MKQFRYLGHDVEFDEDQGYRPDVITVDGAKMSMSAHNKHHGYSWKAEADGNVLCYEADTPCKTTAGLPIYQGIKIPQGKFLQSETALITRAVFLCNHQV